VTHFGKVRGINTNAFDEGDVLFVSPTSAGALTNVEPSSTQLKLPAAFVVTKSATVGAVQVRVTVSATIEQGQKADSAVQPGDDASVLGSGDAVAGYVLSADGDGNTDWVEASGGGATDYVRTRSGTVQDLFDMADTWNDAATTFTAIKMNVTDTASATASNLIDLQVGGVSKFRVAKNGNLTLDTANVILNTGFTTTTFLQLYANSRLYPGGNGSVQIAGSLSAHAVIGLVGLTIGSDKSIGWFNTTGFALGGAAPAQDLSLFRDAADTLAQRRGTNPQAFNLYNTFTDASNYERGFMRWVSNELRIGTEAVGTGTGRPLFFEVPRIVLCRPGLGAGDISFVPRRSNAFDIAQAGGGAPLYQFDAGWLKARFNYQYA
jgi:hypothetical protein